MKHWQTAQQRLKVTVLFSAAHTNYIMTSYKRLQQKAAGICRKVPLRVLDILEKREVANGNKVRLVGFAACTGMPRLITPAMPAKAPYSSHKIAPKNGHQVLQNTQCQELRRLYLVRKARYS